MVYLNFVINIFLSQNKLSNIEKLEGIASGNLEACHFSFM